MADQTENESIGFNDNRLELGKLCHKLDTNWT